MRIYTSITWNIETGAVLAHDFYEYVGPVEECKKGRGEQKDIMRSQLAEMKREAAEKWRQLGLAEPTIQELESETGPGRISRYAAAQMAAERDDIARQFAGLRATAIRSLGARGLAPDRSGLAHTSMNALARGESEAETGSFRTALGNTLQQRMAALNARLGQRAEAGQSSLASGGLSSDAAYKLSQMGSGFGDVMGGISQAVGIASDLFAPGSGMLRRKIGGGIKPSQGSAIGGYVPSR